MPARMNIPLDETTRLLRYHNVTKGSQTLLNIEGTSSLVVIVNPDDNKRKPYFYYRDKDFEDYVEMGGT